MNINSILFLLYSILLKIELTKQNINELSDSIPTTDT